MGGGGNILRGTISRRITHCGGVGDERSRPPKASNSPNHKKISAFLKGSEVMSEEVAPLQCGRVVCEMKTI